MAAENLNKRQQTRYGSLTTLLQPYLEDTVSHRLAAPEGDGAIHYADFGCGTSATPVAYANFVAGVVKRRFGLRRELVCHFADLPSNDFNSLFRQLWLPVEGEEEEQERSWLAVGVPGSLYTRLFPRSSLHIVIATLSLHFLPEIPPSVCDKTSPAFNKGHIGVHGSSPAVAEAFAEASRKGLRRFFECRAEEMAPSGVLAFFCTGRRDQARPEVQYPDNTMIFTLHLEKAWKDLVHEGVIPEERLDSFNVKAVSPSVDDIREAVECPTCEFHIQSLEYIPDFNPFAENVGDTMFKDENSFATILTGMVKGSMSSTVAAHLGADLMEALFERLRHNFEKEYLQRKSTRFFMPVPLCLAVLVRK